MEDKPRTAERIMPRVMEVDDERLRLLAKSQLAESPPPYQADQMASPDGYLTHVILTTKDGVIIKKELAFAPNRFPEEEVECEIGRGCKTQIIPFDVWNARIIKQSPSGLTYEELIADCVGAAAEEKAAVLISESIETINNLGEDFGELRRRIEEALHKVRPPA